MPDDDLEILVSRTSVAVIVLDASVWKDHLLVVVRQLLLTCPAGDLLGLPTGSPVAVVAAAIPLWKELPPELVVGNHSPLLAALLADALLATLVTR